MRAYEFLLAFFTDGSWHPTYHQNLMIYLFCLSLLCSFLDLLGNLKAHEKF